MPGGGPGKPVPMVKSVAAGTAPRLLETSDLGPWRPAWDALVLAAPLPTPFLRSWWLGAQRAVHDGSALFVLVVQGEQLLGGQALQVDRVLGAQRIQALGQGPLAPDHLDLVAAPGHEDRVVDLLSGWWRARRRTLVDLDGLVEDSRLAAAIGSASVPREAAPYLRTVDLGGDYVSTRSSNLRRAVRRARRDFERDGMALTRADLGEPADVDRALAGFVALHSPRPDRAPLLGEMPVLSRAVHAGVQAGEARVHVLGRPGEQPVAVSLAWWCAGRLSTYQVARSLEREHAHAGTLMMVDMIEQGVADGATEADLLRGDAAYKLRLADEQRDLVLVRTGVGVLPRAVLGAHAARQRVRAGRQAFTRSSPSESSPED